MTSWPRAIEILRIALAILSTAMRRKPSAISLKLHRADRAAIGHLLQPCFGRRRIERLIAFRPEHGREIARADAAKEQVAVGDRQRSAAAIAGRPRLCARALRSDAEAHPVEAADRPAARSDG